MKGAYYKAFLREKEARLEAESVLEEKTRSLYLAKQQLIEVNAALLGHNRELIKSEKLAALGRLSAGVAHEIRNPLAYIQSNIGFVEEFILEQQNVISNLFKRLESPADVVEDETLMICDEGEVHEIQDLIADVNKGLGRIEEISSSLTGYSHKNKEKQSLLDINEVVNDALKILESTKALDTKIKVDLGTLPLIHGSESEYSQIFLNLIANSLHAVKGVSVGLVSITTEFNSKGIAVVISDNGHGMSKATLDRAFDPFYTTKGVGEGTGLGLYLSHTIIEKQNGTIKVKSKLGEGTRFDLFFPIGV